MTRTRTTPEATDTITTDTLDKDNLTDIET